MKDSNKIPVEHILISLLPCHAANIYSGIKSVEFRRRKLNISVGTIVWIYEKMPLGAITGFATVKSLANKSPQELWELYSPVSGLSESEFFDYFINSINAYALELEHITRLKTPATLDQLRRIKATFQPPQFFTRLLRDDKILLKLHDHSGKTDYSAIEHLDPRFNFLVA